MNLLLDNSALSLLFCKRKFQLTVINGLAKEEEENLNQGSAFHIIQEHRSKGDSMDASIVAAEKKYPNLSLDKVLGASVMYNTVSKLPPAIEINGVKAIEYKFRFVYGNYIMPHLPEPVTIELCGTLDHLGIEGDTLVFIDFKAPAAKSPAHMERIMDSYLLSFQVPFYIWAICKSGMLPAPYLELVKSGRYRSELHFVFYNCEPPIVKKQRRGAFSSEFLDREVPHIVNSKIQEAINIAVSATSAPHDGMNVYNACTYCQFKPACMELGTEKEIEYLSRFPAKQYNPMEFR